jgi:hypothetical protein
LIIFQVRSLGKKIVIIIFTDVIPTDGNLLLDYLAPVNTLPVSLVVRLGTGKKENGTEKEERVEERSTECSCSCLMPLPTHATLSLSYLSNIHSYSSSHTTHPFPLPPSNRIQPNLKWLTTG